MPTTIDDARKLIQFRLAELDDRSARLRRALEGPGERSPLRDVAAGRKNAVLPENPAASTSAKPPADKRKSARAPRSQRRQQLLKAVKANPGARPAELAKEIGISSNQVHALIAKARAEKLIVKRGRDFAVEARSTFPPRPCNNV